MKTWILDNLDWLLALALLLGAAAVVAAVLLWRALERQREAIEVLEVRFGTLQEQSQRELVGMGQRVIEAEKSVRRFSERIEALEAATPAAERYGQLGPLLAGKLLSSEGEAESSAELQLKALLARGKSEPE